MKNIIALIILILLLVIIKIIYLYTKKDLSVKRIFIELCFDFLGICVLYMLPFVIVLLDTERTLGLPDFISQGPLLFRVILAVLLLLGLPAFLAYTKGFTLNKFSISTDSYFWIRNTAYFIFVIPIFLGITSGIVDKFIMH